MLLVPYGLILSGVKKRCGRGSLAYGGGSLTVHSVVQLGSCQGAFRKGQLDCAEFFDFFYLSQKINLPKVPGPQKKPVMLFQTLPSRKIISCATFRVDTERTTSACMLLACAIDMAF